MATEAVRRKYMYAGPITSTKIIFFHNVLHDMESVVWSIFSNLANVPAEDEAGEAARDAIVSSLFSGNFTDAEKRNEFIRSFAHFQDYSTLLGEKYVRLLEILADMIAALVDYYVKSEAGIRGGGPIDITQFRGIHKDFRAIWADCLVILKDSPIPIALPQKQEKPASREPASEKPQTSKRRRIENENENDRANVSLSKRSLKRSKQ